MEQKHKNLEIINFINIYNQITNLNNLLQSNINQIAFIYMKKAGIHKWCMEFSKQAQ